MPVIRSSFPVFYGWKYCRHSAFTGREACGIKGAVVYKRTGTGYKRRMRHTVSMKDCEIPHGNMDFVTDPISEPVISPVIPLY